MQMCQETKVSEVMLCIEDCAENITEVIVTDSNKPEDKAGNTGGVDGMEAQWRLG